MKRITPKRLEVALAKVGLELVKEKKIAAADKVRTVLQTLKADPVTMRKFARLLNKLWVE